MNMLQYVRQQSSYRLLRKFIDILIAFQCVVLVVGVPAMVKQWHSQDTFEGTGINPVIIGVAVFLGGAFIVFALRQSALVFVDIADTNLLMLARLAEQTQQPRA